MSLNPFFYPSLVEKKKNHQFSYYLFKHKYLLCGVNHRAQPVCFQDLLVQCPLRLRKTFPALYLNITFGEKPSVAEIKELLSLFGSLDSNSSHPHYSAVSGVCVKARRSQSSPAQAKPLTPAIKEQLSTGGQSEGPQRWLPKVTFKSDCSACSADKRPL